MRSQEPAGDVDPPRDPLLEAAFTHFVQQAQAPPEFAARVRAQAQRQRAEGWPRPWGRRLVVWLGTGGPWGGSGDAQREQWLARPRLSWVGVGVLVTCLVLSVLGNVWLGVQLVGQAQLAQTAGELWPSSGAPQGPYGRVRLAFTHDVREQDLRALLLSLRATILAGPSPQGLYLVQVPLAWLVPRLRGSAETPTATDPMHLLLEELRAHPAVRLAEPVTPGEYGTR